MIRISCTNCKTVLSIDDAFAGGVCRCQHCGTIQTVPSQPRGTVQAGSPSGVAMGGSKSLYQGDARTGSGSGLDELANVVVSSGLTSSRLKRRSESDGGRAGKQNLMPFIIGGTVLVAVLLVVVIILLSKSSTASTSSPNPVVNTPGVTSSTPVLPPNTPGFCGTALAGNTVIYLLDSGSGSASYLGSLMDATINSVASLGPDRKFQIIFWKDDTEGDYPQTTTTYASKENIASAQKAIGDVVPYGQSDVTAGLKLAIASIRM